LLFPFGVSASFFERFGLLLTAMVSAMVKGSLQTEPAQNLMCPETNQSHEVGDRSIDATDELLQQSRLIVM
jgi:hypothetical protein